MKLKIKFLVELIAANEPSGSGLNIGESRSSIQTKKSPKITTKKSTNFDQKRSRSIDSRSSSGHGGSSAMSSAEGLGGGVNDLCQIIEYAMVYPSYENSKNNLKINKNGAQVLIAQTKKK